MTFRFDGVTVTDNSATVMWGTNYSATSRVAYGTVSAGVNNTPPNYGETFSTPTYDSPPNETALHNVTINGLLASTLYYFKIISGNAADETERSFVTTAPVTTVTTETPPPSGGQNPPSGGGESSGGTPSGQGDQGTGGAPTTPPAPGTEVSGGGATSTSELAQTGGEELTTELTALTGNENPPGRGLLAGLFGLGTDNLFFDIFIIILLLLLLILLIYRIIRWYNARRG